MFKNRFILVIGVISLLLVTMAISKPFSGASTARLVGANDFYQRHRDWSWANGVQNAVIPVTGSLDRSDYFLRHPELQNSLVPIDTSDYFLRHLEFSTN